MAATTAVVSSTTTTSCRQLFAVSAPKSPRARLSLSTSQNRGSLQTISVAMAQEELEVGQIEATARLKNTKLYFGNLPYNCDGEKLAGIIQDYARPEMIEVLYNKETGRSRGFAFVTMSTTQDCEVVIANLNGFQYDGRTLRVKFSDKSKPRGPLHIESEFKLFVGNLSWSVTSEALKQVFKEYGNLVSSNVIYDGETGRSRGYGFVCFTTKEEMDFAMESLNGVELERRALSISMALAKKT